jgi:nucleoside-diphosphate-sugar epimerase
LNASADPVLVTGASGFIGRHLVEALLAQNARVIALCRPQSQLPQHWRAKVERVDCPGWSLDAMRAALGDRAFGCLFHLAAYGVVPTDRDGAAMFAINAQLPQDLIRLCKDRGAAMVMAGSSAEYRPPESKVLLTEDSPLESEKTYGASKAKGSVEACRIANDLSVRLRVLRLFNVYGPGEASHRLLPSLVSGLAANHRIALSEGRQVRDFVYVGDVVEAFLAAADHRKTHAGMPAQIWNVATGEGHSVREFAEMTARASGMKADLLGFGDLPMRPDEIEWLVGSCDRIRMATGWSAHHDLSSGIATSLARMTGGTTQARAAQ